MATHDTNHLSNSDHYSICVCSWIESTLLNSHQLKFAVFIQGIVYNYHCVHMCVYERARRIREQTSTLNLWHPDTFISLFIFAMSGLEHQYRRRFIFIAQWIINANKSNKFICLGSGINAKKRREKINNESPHSLNFGFMDCTLLVDSPAKYKSNIAGGPHIQYE